MRLGPEGQGAVKALPIVEDLDVVEDLRPGLAVHLDFVTPRIGKCPMTSTILTVANFHNLSASYLGTSSR